MADKIISKTQNAESGLIYVKRTIVKGDGKNNFLAVQLHNGADFIIDGVSLRVDYLNREGGSVHESKELTVNNLMGLPESDFILPDIPMPAARESANIKIYAVTSGDCYYRLSDDGKGIESEVHSAKKSPSGAAGSKSAGGTKVKIYALYAAFVAALYILAFAVGFSGLLIGGESSQGGDGNIEIVTEIGDQDV